ncbi:MAG: helix-turn-helix domain-containing protein [Phycisphaerales bacterium]|nr:helix-turn-helix domain-containing protein [Phycisphaerales bacterium]
MPRRKDVLTTGEVALICHVAPRTVSKWFDTGRLKGYRVPGSKDRRIPRSDLVRFMKAHDMPMGDVERGVTRVLIVEPDRELGDAMTRLLQNDMGFESERAESAFAAGMAVSRFDPQIMVVNTTTPALRHAMFTSASVNAAHPRPKLVAIAADATEAQSLNGYDACLIRPIDRDSLLRTIESLVGNSAVARPIG